MPEQITLSQLRAHSPRDFVLRGGTVREGSDFTVARAVWVREGRIAAIGGEEDLRDRAFEVDLGGATVLPGLQDTHFHLMSTGSGLRSLDLSACTTLDELFALLRNAEDLGGDGWIIAAALDESRLAERRTPTLTELDALGERPIYINDRGLHFCLLNTTAARLLGLEEETRAADGRMQESLSGLAKARLGAQLPQAWHEESLRVGARHAAELGLTRLHAIEGGELFPDADAEHLRGVQDSLATLIHLLWSTDDVAAIAATGARAGGGDVCIDGALGSHTARLFSDYHDRPGERGTLVRDTKETTRLFSEAQDAGIQFGVHAIGDQAVGIAVEAIAMVTRGDNALRHRIEHFGMPSVHDIERAAELGIGVSTQPTFAFLRGRPGGVYDQRIGPERLTRAYPLRSLIEAGLVVSGGSDSDVTNADPLLGIHAAVNHPVESERISTVDALKLYTTAAEWMRGGEPHDALIAVGNPANLTVLDRDPLSTDPTALQELRAVATIVDGRSVGR